MLPADEILEQARITRDARFDGRFFVGVKTTGIYCRPICPVKMPRSINVRFFENAAAASEAGFRPCLRCRPEASPGTPAWRGTSTTVIRALRLINEGALDDDGVAELSTRLGITSRHLNRLFVQHLGASPKAIAQTRRLQFAKKMVDQTDLPMTEIALSSGYGSVRRFNDHFQKTYQRTPRSLRKEKDGVSDTGISLRLSYRSPYDFDSLLNFYRIRATPGIESVDERRYRRVFSFDGQSGTLEVTQDADASQLICRVECTSPRRLMPLIERVRRMFDVDAVPDEINRVLSRDRALRARVKKHPGLRLPGAFDEFEIAVRAIVGQQVSVKGATTVMGKIVEVCNERVDGALCFPSPTTVAAIKPGTLPMPGKREQALKSLALAIESGEVEFDVDSEEAFEQQLTSIPGIGPWTAQYISMRARGNPDAFLSGDLVIRKSAASLFGIEKESELLMRAEQWRPWRGYAGMHLWRAAADQTL